MAKKTPQAVPAFESFDEGVTPKELLDFFKKEAKRFGGFKYILDHGRMNPKNWNGGRTSSLAVGGSVVGGWGMGAAVSHIVDISSLEINTFVHETEITVGLFGVPMLKLLNQDGGGAIELETIYGFYEILETLYIDELFFKVACDARRYLYENYNNHTPQNWNAKGGPARQLIYWIMEDRQKGLPFEPKTK